MRKTGFAFSSAGVILNAKALRSVHVTKFYLIGKMLALIISTLKECLCLDYVKL